MQDLLSIYDEEEYWESFDQLINKLKLGYAKEDEALGNICVHYAMYLGNSNQQEKSIEHFKLARNLFNKVDEDHYVIQQINGVLNEKA